MIPIIQTKFALKDKFGFSVQRGNCYAAVIASILEVPITEVPNVEVLFHIESYSTEVMHTFLNSLGWDLCTDNRFMVFHDKNYGIDSGTRQQKIEYCKDRYYFVSGQSIRGVKHITIWQNGIMVHDPHPSGDGIETFEHFESLEKK